MDREQELAQTVVSMLVQDMRQLGYGSLVDLIKKSVLHGKLRDEG